MSAEGRGSVTRQKLLEVAEKEFARYGYAGAHLQSIAEQVGVQKTALYYYFAGKQALYSAVLVAMLEAFDAEIAASIAGEGSYPERLERLVDRFNAMLAEHPNHARILVRIFVDGTGVSDDVAPATRRVIGRVIAFYREGIDAGDFRRHSSRHFFQSLLGMIVFHFAAPEFSAELTGVEDTFSSESLVWRSEEVKRLLFEGVLARPGQGPL